MPIIVPSVTAYTPAEYRQQMERIAPFAARVHIDLMDGKFTPKPNLGPENAWWPVGIKADIHLMYQQADSVAEAILEHQPHLLIIHAEAEGSFGDFADLCHKYGVKVGVGLLPSTAVDTIIDSLAIIDHVMIFSGDLGSFGGRADLELLKKVHSLKQRQPSIEIGWDGGISEQNISQLALGGVDVFDVGGFIHDAADPEKAYQTLERIAAETSTT